MPLILALPRTPGYPVRKPRQHVEPHCPVDWQGQSFKRLSDTCRRAQVLTQQLHLRVLSERSMADVVPMGRRQVGHFKLLQIACSHLRGVQKDLGMTSSCGKPMEFVILYDANLCCTEEGTRCIGCCFWAQINSYQLTRFSIDVDTVFFLILCVRLKTICLHDRCLGEETLTNISVWFPFL